MKFIKGMIVGSLLSAGIVMAYSDNMASQRKKMIKKGRQFAKKMGMIQKSGNC